MSTPNVCRVLVVDDNRDTVESLAMLLRLAGNEVDTASDGPQAVHNAVSFQPDVILLDLGLPHMHGHDVCREIRKRVAPHRPLMIAVTGHGHEEIRQRSAEAGFDAHLLKPVNYDELTAMIQNHCQRKTPPAT
jgi:DNA-binding response OmpR family regulator